MGLRAEHAAIIDRYLRAVVAGDSATAGSCLDDDFVEIYPQSGERIVGRVDAMKALALQPGRPLPDGDLHLTSCGEDRVMLETLLDYGSSRYWLVALYEISRGLIHRSTAYFAAPFPAPDWRSGWVERFDPLDPGPWQVDGDGTAVDRSVVERLARAVAADDVPTIRAGAHPEYRGSFVQSGEAFDLEGLVAMNAAYPGGLPAMEVNRVEGDSERWVVGPSNLPIRITGGGDTWFGELLMRYPSGERFHGVWVQILRRRLLWRQRFYYCAPFEPAPFRADLVERIEPLSTLD